jgi:hypothetical protein
LETHGPAAVIENEKFDQYVTYEVTVQSIQTGCSVLHCSLCISHDMPVTFSRHLTRAARDPHCFAYTGLIGYALFSPSAGLEDNASASYENTIRF